MEGYSSAPRLGLLLLCVDSLSAVRGTESSFVGHYLSAVGGSRIQPSRRKSKHHDKIILGSTGGVLRISMGNDRASSSSSSSLRRLLCSDVEEEEENEEDQEGSRASSSSSTNTRDCQIRFRNEYCSGFLVCWVDGKGKLHHYYPVDDGSIRDGSVSNEHTEYTQTGHSFIVIAMDGIDIDNEDSLKLPEYISDITNERMLCYYKPLAASYRHEVTIRTKRLRSFSTKTSANVSVKLVKLNNALRGGENRLIDTSKKQYLKAVIAGFTCMYEEGVFEELTTLKETLEQDLGMVHFLLPAEAYLKLKNSTKIWINKSITYGTTEEPVVGRACTYHPLGGASWLMANGMRVDKCGCVEMYCASDYLQSRGLWGVGGVILHELCHAFHDQHCSKGFENPIIRQAYTDAMRCKTYDSVQVHGEQGLHGPVKAYACTNCMEFFAELSVAFHWCRDDVTEYNKWFPFNRAQLIMHDAQSYQVLSSIWGS